MMKKMKINWAKLSIVILVSFNIAFIIGFVGFRPTDKEPTNPAVAVEQAKKELLQEIDNMELIKEGDKFILISSFNTEITVENLQKRKEILEKDLANAKRLIIQHEKELDYIDSFIDTISK